MMTARRRGYLRNFGTRTFSTIFTGIQPSGTLHLGNYFGSVKIFLQNQFQSKFETRIFSIADLHSMTVPSRTGLPNNTMQTAALLLASGIDPQSTILFRQSDVLEHASLMWLFLCRLSVARLSRMIQWKEKSAKFGENAGLLTYPALQASDVLLYRANSVPVGSDQTQHLELTVEIAKKINNEFNEEIFTIPSPLFCQSKIKSLRNPMEKMSKSDPSKDACIFISDGPDEIRRKISRAVTDGLGGLTYEPESRPGISALLELYSLSSGESIEAIISKYPGKNVLSSFKSDLTELLIAKFNPIREEYLRINADPSFVENTLQNGSVHAHEIASTNLKYFKSKLML